jgi:hypothetical protein
MEENLGYTVMLLVCLICFTGGMLAVLKIRQERSP